MNIRDLEYFYQLSQLHSFTAVAKQCQVSQPTVTYAVKRLEEHFDCDLLVKDPSHRSVVLTRQGEVVARHAEAIMVELRTLHKEVKNSVQSKPRIGFPPIIRSKVLSQLIAKDQDLGFLAEMSFDTKGSLDLLAELISGDLSFSLLGSLHALDHPKLITQELYQLPFYILLSERHPLATRKEVSFGELLEERFIILDEGHVHMKAFQQLNERYHNQVEPFLELSEVAAIGQLVERSVGISLVTDVTYFQDMGGLVALPLVPSEQLYFHVSYAYAKNTTLPPIVQKFVTLLEKTR